MREGLFWLDDLQWSSIKDCLPGRKRRGPRRVDDRRVISGIVHVLQSGMRWRDCPQEYGPSTTIYNRWHRWSQQGLWQRMFHELSQIVGTHYENAIDSTAIKVHRSARGKKGGQDQALGTSRGGCTTKVHAVIDRKGRPLRFLLSGGHCFDGKAAVPLLKPLPPPKKLLADKAYDCAAFRDWLSRRGTTPVIPNKINRRKPYPHNKRAYRHRNKIERMFCRLKDARRIATRYDKCANNFLSAVCLVALIYFWLN